MGACQQLPASARAQGACAWTSSAPCVTAVRPTWWRNSRTPRPCWRGCGSAAPCAEATGHPDAADARELREAVHTLITDARTGRTPGTHARDRVNSAAAHAVPVPHLTPAGHLAQHADDPVRATLSLVARDALDLVTSPSLARLRNCAGPTCGALFLDISRPGNRRWCSMGTCGNRAKKETLRGRTV